MRVDYRERPRPALIGKVVNADTGEVIRDCFLFDTEAGEWGQYLRNEAGAFYPDPADRTRAARRFGRASRLLFLPAEAPHGI